NEDFQKFISENKGWSVYKVEVKALDFHSAVYKAKQRLQISFDLLSIGHSLNNIFLKNHCFVIGEIDKSRAKKYYLQYQLDGYYANNTDLYKKFISSYSE